MSVAGCQGLRAVNVISLKPTKFDQSPPGARSELHKVICVLHICYLCVPHCLLHSGSNSPLPCRDFFFFFAFNSLPPTVWWSSLTSPSVSQYATQRQSEVRREMVLKRAQEEEKNKLYRVKKNKKNGPGMYCWSNHSSDKTFV